MPDHIQCHVDGLRTLKNKFLAWYPVPVGARFSLNKDNGEWEAAWMVLLFVGKDELIRSF
jgi:hypothetical protein